MIKYVRRLRDQFDIPPSRVYNFDEIRVYASPQDLHSETLEYSSVTDPFAKKVSNPKEAYTGIICANGSGEDLQVCLVTNKKLPPDAIVYTSTIQERILEDDEVQIVDVEIDFAVIHGVVVLKVPAGGKAWCSVRITKAWLDAHLFRIDEPSIVQVRGFIFLSL